MKGILTSGFLIGLYIFDTYGVVLIEQGEHPVSTLVSVWVLGCIVSLPFWLLFEAIVEKIKA